MLDQRNPTDRLWISLIMAMTAYKLVSEHKGRPKTLFHGVDGSRDIPTDCWFASAKRLVRDGTSKTYYLSGFHSLPTLEECLKYLENFKNTDDKRIVKIYVKDYWIKKHSRHNVLLSTYVYIKEKDWAKRVHPFLKVGHEETMLAVQKVNSRGRRGNPLSV